MTFPIMRSLRERKEYEGIDCPRTFPLALVARHETQAMRNHGGQTLAVLASRGGLCADELVAVLEDRPYRWMPLAEAVQSLKRLAEEVGTGELTVPEIAAARAADVLRVDADGLGFVPREWLERIRQR